MTLDEANERLDLSRRVITGWEELDAPSGSPRDGLKMIYEEIEVLQGIGTMHTELAVEAARIANRYDQLAKLLKLRIP